MMTANINRMVYRGIQYSVQKVNLLKKKFFRRELVYRGTKYIPDQAPKKPTEKGRMCYRGTFY